MANAQHQIPSEKDHAIEQRLGDLDLKSSAAKKVEYWKSSESDLIEEGWYTGREKDSGGSKDWCII